VHLASFKNFIPFLSNFQHENKDLDRSKIFRNQLINFSLQLLLLKILQSEEYHLMKDVNWGRKLF